ncbi:MAG: hypothetical protein KDB88_02265 [Flavobacteriales bacterium]|nr:hypothetical protein [Flavobacteriales bacterium]
MTPVVKLWLRLLGIAVLTLIGGAAMYGIIYAPRFFKVLAMLVLVLGIYLLYLMVKHWLTEISASRKNASFTEAEIIED